MKGLETRYENVDLVIVRENTEDLYAGIEHMVGPDAAESIKIITRAASERIARFAFDYAVANGRHKVTAVHKANIMKLSDGLFLESCRTVAADFDGRIEFEDRIVDNMCMQLVQNPDLYDGVERAVRDVIAEGRTVTYDLGGTAGTRAFADAVIGRLESQAGRSAVGGVSS